MTRLFIGTFISEADQERLASFQVQNAGLEEIWERKVRWVKPEKAHMTWIFLGSLSDDLVQPISDMLNNLVTSELKKHTDRTPIKIEFEHAEIWPDTRKPRQLVLRPSEVDDRVMSLARVLRNGLLEFYFENSEKEEVRSFKPHLTMLRLERRQEAPFSRATGRIKLADIKETKSVLPLALALDKIALVESTIGKGSAYKILHEVAITSKL